LASAIVRLEPDRMTGSSIGSRVLMTHEGLERAAAGCRSRAFTAIVETANKCRPCPGARLLSRAFPDALVADYREGHPSSRALDAPLPSESGLTHRPDRWALVSPPRFTSTPAASGLHRHPQCLGARSRRSSASTLQTALLAWPRAAGIASALRFRLFLSASRYFQFDRIPGILVCLKASLRDFSSHSCSPFRRCWDSPSQTGAHFPARHARGSPRS